LIHAPVAKCAYKVEGAFRDTLAESECDIYHMEVTQYNNQCAWVAPVFVY
jgi:hypothetical protein